MLCRLVAPGGLRMKKSILRITVVILSIFASLIVLTNLSVAQDSRNQESTVTTKPPETSADQVLKKIKVWVGSPQSQLYPTMRFMGASLGFQCGVCHVIRNGVIDAPLDDKPEKQSARQMIKMVIEVNKTLFQGNPTVSCYTCHRGHRTPQNAVPLPIPSPPAPTSASSISTGS